MDENKNYTALAMNALEAVYIEAAIKQIEYFCERVGKDVPAELGSKSLNELLILQLMCGNEWVEKFYGPFLNNKELNADPS